MEILWTLCTIEFAQNSHTRKLDEFTVFKKSSRWRPALPLYFFLEILQEFFTFYLLNFLRTVFLKNNCAQISPEGVLQQDFSEKSEKKKEKKNNSDKYFQDRFFIEHIRTTTSKNILNHMSLYATPNFWKTISTKVVQVPQRWCKYLSFLNSIRKIFLRVHVKRACFFDDGGSSIKSLVFLCLLSPN